MSWKFGGSEWKDARVPARYRLTVRERLVVLRDAHAFGITPASRRFGLDRKTVRAWRDRCRAGGVPGLVPRYPARRPRRISPAVIEQIASARRELDLGASKIRI